MFVVAMIAALLPASLVGAQQQNEIVLTVDFDGTAGFSGADPLDNGLGAHTPGLDLNANNNVVRTFDQIQYRIDWNVNEVDGTTTTVAMTLPEGMEWLPDATTNSGVPSGCLDDGTSSITGLDGRELICNTDAEHEGSNGAIHPRAFVRGFLDGTVLAVEASIGTDQLPPVVSNVIETTVSAAPGGDWVKGEVLEDDTSGAVIAYIPDEEYEDVPDATGALGYLMVWNLRLEPSGGLKGSEPLNDSVDLEFWDHFFEAPAGARLATPAEMLAATGAARVPCGGYDGDGGYPFGVTAPGPGSTPPAQTNTGLITCTDLGSAATGYPVLKFDITGHDTSNIAAQNANGSGNSATLISAQVAFWIPAPTPNVVVDVVNAITGSADAVVPGSAEFDPIVLHGSGGPLDEVSESGSGDAGISNGSPYGVLVTPPGNPGRAIRHTVRYQNGPYAEIQYEDAAGNTYLNYDRRTKGFGGNGRVITNGSNGVDENSTRWDGDGQTPRGNILTVQNVVSTITTRDDGSPYSEPIHSCVAVDTTHQEVIGMPASFPISLAVANPAQSAFLQALNVNLPTVGGVAGTPATPVAQVMSSQVGTPTLNYTVSRAMAVQNSSPELDWTLEVADLGDPGNSVAINDLSCNGDEGTWVDASTGDLSVFQTGTLDDGTPVYGDITHFRLRTAGDVPWNSGLFNNAGTSSYGSRLQLNFQVRVKDDPLVQVADQELFVYASRAWGEWDGSGQPPTTSCTNSGRFGTDETGVPAGWCNLGFADDGVDTLDVTAPDTKNDYDLNAVEQMALGAPAQAHADVVYIVEPALAISKVNTDGPSDIVANGQTAEFEINPMVVGASSDSIHNVTVGDPLHPNMEFVRFTSQPAGDPCAFVSGAISCSFGNLAGGWGALGEGKFSYEVLIVDAGPDLTLTNTATIRGFDSTAGLPVPNATARANTFTGAPFEESGIEKAVDAHLTECFEAPGTGHDAGDCTVVATDGGMIFTLDIENEGNLDLDNYRVVDVLPYNGDAVEPPSAAHPFTGVALVGDGRTPPSDFSGTLEFVAANGPAGSTVLYSADDPATISRDPAVAESGTTTWCDAPAGGAAVAAGLGATAGAGACPASAADVTAIHVDIGSLSRGATEFIEVQMTTIGADCGDIWTNNFGARTFGLYLPIRSNDVSVMSGFCEPSIDIEKSTNGLDSDTPDGAQIVVGDPVTWTYVVTNDGDTALANATVADVPAPAGGIDCDVDGDGVLDGTNVIPLMLPGDAVTCEATGVAAPGPFMNNASVSGDMTFPDFSDPSIDPADPSTWPTDPTAFETYTDPVTGDVTMVDDEDPSHYTGVELEPAIDIEKDTNGAQSDVVPGESLVAGQEVTWTYEVTNTGTAALLDAEVTDVDSTGTSVAVDCDVDGDGVFDGTNIVPLLLPTETVTCQSTGTAQPGPYSNNATVSGTTALSNDSCVCDPTDPSTWPQDATSYGAYVDPVTGETIEVDDQDPSHYTGVEPAIDIEKDTNGADSDTSPGEVLIEGTVVTWTYVVTNTGATALADATVTDVPAPVGGIDCDIDGDGAFDGTNIIPMMLPNDSVTCQATGVAGPGPFTNNASVGGTAILPDFSDPAVDPADPSTWPTDPTLYETPIDPATGEPIGVTDEDPSNYTGATLEPGIDIEKDTNGVQSDEAPGEDIAFGDAVTWTYLVTNVGGTGLVNAEVADSDPTVVVDCDMDGDGVFDGTNVIPFLAFAASVTCQGTGTAQVGPYMNTATVSGDPVRPDFSDPNLDPSIDPDDPSTWPTDPAGYVAAIGPDGELLGSVDDADDSHYTGTATFDLALEKTVADSQDTSNLAIGDDITYTIEVFNQGTVDASDITVIDYTPSALAVNDTDWTIDTDGNGTIELAGVTLAPGESTTVDITMTILAAGDIDNTAEISGSTPVDANGDEILGPDGMVLADVDSLADGDDSDVLADGITDGTDGDEDDHDVASITVVQAVPVLAFTGDYTMQLFIAALLAVGAGMALTMFASRTRTARKER